MVSYKLKVFFQVFPALSSSLSSLTGWLSNWHKKLVPGEYKFPHLQISGSDWSLLIGQLTNVEF